VRPSGGSPFDPITLHTPCVIEFEYWNDRPDVYLHPTFYLHNEQGILICSTGPTFIPNWREKTFPTGLIRTWCNIPGDLLNNGMHRVSVHLAKNDQTLYRKDDALSFDVQDTADKRDGWYGEWKGAIRPMFDWDTEIVSENIVDVSLNDRFSGNGR
jgi:lipopolysaccharide transport system ATP-binding protein